VQWRLEMWEVLRKEIPTYLLLGKGYAIDPTALEFSAFNARRGYTMQAEWAVLTGEYHNGPLSVLIPLGLGGAVTFGWFLVVSVRRLWGFCRNGDPGLLQINRTLLAMFVAKIVIFTVFFGSLYSELVGFVCIIGLAESLNTPREVPAEEPAAWPNGLWEGGRA
jgi:O-antigen ligase